MDNKLLYLLTAALVLASGCQTVEPSDTALSGQPFYEYDYVPGVVNIKVTETLAEQLGDEGSLLEMPGSHAVRMFADGGRFEERMRREGLHLWYRLAFDESMTLTKASDALSSVNGVETVEYRHRISITDVGSPFDDPYFSAQWHFWNEGGGGLHPMAAGCDINVLPAWKRGIVGDERVIVAVIDGGVDFNHEDLHDNMWTNPETGSRVTYGYNFDAGNDIVTATDHGTHVAGVISAVNNNGIGVNGIAGGDAAKGIKGVRIMSCQTFSSLNHGDGDNAEAIVWAANHGAVIAQNSWGYDLSKVPDMSDTPKSMKEAIDYFNEYAGCDNDGNQLSDSPMKGGVVIFAAGNDAMEIGFPASYEGCIAVASVAGDFTPAYYTNYGDWVDISAPGGDSSKRQEITSTVPDNGYDKMQGTSMACPHVSGVAALIVSEFGGPGFTREECIERLLKTTTPVKANIKIGSGIVNAADAVAHYGEYLPNNAAFAGYEAESATSLILRFIVPEMNHDVKCRTLNVFLSGKESDSPASIQKTVDFATLAIGDTVSVHIGGLEVETEYSVSTIAIDALGNESEKSETISVVTQSNNPPTIEPLQGVEVTMKRYMTESLEFSIYDRDNNLEKVNYTAACHADSFKEKNGIYVLTIEGRKAEPGDYISTIEAIDALGGSTSVDIHFTIEQNQAPVVKGIEDMIIIGSQKSIEINLGEYFTHPDGDELVFTAEVPGDAVVSTNVLNASRKMTVRSNSLGYSDVTVTATDTFGLTAKCSFKVAVMANNGYEVYPNPVTNGKMYIRSPRNGGYSLSVVNGNGAVVRTVTVTNNPFEPYCMNVSDLSAGRYTVNIKDQDLDSSHTIAIF
ncbi:MAG: S8 family serine peptidase [Bacteroidia bacterium]|nr:S8 family serine peptidase [Bacteroidia bacterium]